MEQSATDETFWQSSYSCPEDVGKPEFKTNELSCLADEFKAAKYTGCDIFTHCLQLGLQ